MLSPHAVAKIVFPTTTYSACTYQATNIRSNACLKHLELLGDLWHACHLFPIEVTAVNHTVHVTRFVIAACTTKRCIETIIAVFDDSVSNS